MLVLACALLFAPSESRLQLGTKWSVEETLHYYSTEAEVDETHRFRIDFRVHGLEHGMWVVERSSYLLDSKIGTTDLGAPPTKYPDIFQEWVSPAGFLLDIDPVDRGVFNLDRLTHYWLPFSEPDEWVADLSSGLMHFTAKGHAQFKVVGQPTRQSREYDFQYRPVEDPSETSAAGKMTFDPKTGRLLRAKIEAKRAIMPGGIDRANVSISYQYLEPPKVVGKS